jgi:hypothetical protein
MLVLARKQNEPELFSPGSLFSAPVILALDEAFFGHLLVAEPQIGDIG